MNCLIIFLFIAAFILSKQKTTPYLTQNLELDRKSHGLLYANLLVSGLVIGTNYVIYYFLYTIIVNNIENVDFKLSLDYVLGLFKSIKEILPEQWDVIFLIYAFGILLSILSLILVNNERKFLLSEWRKQIINYYSDNFPSICIKLNSESIYGKIEDIFGENLIVLNENGTAKAVFWKNVEAIEMEAPEMFQENNKHDNKYIW